MALMPMMGMGNRNFSTGWPSMAGATTFSRTGFTPRSNRPKVRSSKGFRLSTSMSPERMSPMLEAT